MSGFLPAGLALLGFLLEGYGQCDSCAQHLCRPDVNILCVFLSLPHTATSAMLCVPAVVCMFSGGSHAPRRLC